MLSLLTDHAILFSAPRHTEYQMVQPNLLWFHLFQVYEEPEINRQNITNKNKDTLTS